MESGQISISPGLSNSNAFVVNTGPRFVNNQEHVPFSSDSIQKKDRKQAIDGLNLGQKKVSKLSDSNMPSNDDEHSINSITTDYVPISKVANLPNVSAISNITKTGNIQVSKETNNKPKHNTVSDSIVTGSFGIDQVVARNTLSARRNLDSVVPTEPTHANHLSKGTSINRNFFDQAVYGNRVQSINTLNVSPNEKTNTGNSIIINLKVHSNDENRFHNSFDKNDDSDFPKSGVSVKSLSTDSPVSSKTNESLFVVTASLQSTPTKVRKAKLKKDKKKSFGTIFVPTKQMAGFVPMKTIVDPLEQFSKDKTEFTEDPEMKIKEKSDITERNISSGKATSMIPAGLTIQIVSSKKDENKHKSPKNAMNGVSWKLKKIEQKAVITKPGTSESPTLSTATEKQHDMNTDSSNIENKPADLYENKHTKTTNVDGSEPTSTRTTNVDGSEPTSTKKQQIKMYSVHPGMVQSITNFENNRLLYNAFRKYKLASQKRQRRSISIPSFLQMRLDKPIKVYNNVYITGKRNQNSIQIKGTNKVRKMFFEVPNNTHSKIETPTESYNDSKVLKTQPEIEVSLNYALENTKNPVYQSNSKSLGVVIHQYTTEKPTLQKRKKSRHTKRHIKDRLFRRISKSLSNGLPIYSKANKERILEKNLQNFFRETS
ncbi:unnamed protein product [Mytilus coruscus]|uniref:Uncharacterized protein n=1 Tax=Mytilus coruscus TaxID=42192 RepID=A0A6J8D814_MYTCO|nr:unnamed protein product [Mytilus coruscus]